MYCDGGCFTDHDIHRYLVCHGIRRVDDEWFRCTADDVRAAWMAVKNRTENSENRTRDFPMRPEQADAVRCAQASGTISVQLVAGGVLSGGMVEHDG